MAGGACRAGSRLLDELADPPALAIREPLRTASGARREDEGLRELVRGQPGGGRGPPFVLGGGLACPRNLLQDGVEARGTVE
jgi:hypothetical protein